MRWSLHGCFWKPSLFRGSQRVGLTVRWIHWGISNKLNSRGASFEGIWIVPFEQRWSVRRMRRDRAFQYTLRGSSFPFTFWQKEIGLWLSIWALLVRKEWFCLLLVWNGFHQWISPGRAFLWRAIRNWNSLSGWEVVVVVQVLEGDWMVRLCMALIYKWIYISECLMWEVNLGLFFATKN